MSKTSVETIQVKALSKFGFQLESGEYVNTSKTLKESEKGKIIPGGTYDVEMYRSDANKGYVNKLLSSALVANTVPVKPVEAKRVVNPVGLGPIAAKPSASSGSETMSKAEWASKDRSMMVGGIFHDVATLVAAAATANVPVAALLADYVVVLKALLEIRDNVK